MASFPISGAQVPSPPPPVPQNSNQPLLLDWAGLQVVSITFQGVSAALLAPLPSQLAQQTGIPLDPAKIRASLRSLYRQLRNNDIRNGRPAKAQDLPEF